MIGDASIIGLDCESGIVDDCNDGTQESVPAECSGIFMAPKETTKCGSQCNLGIPGRNNYQHDKNAPEMTDKYWLLFKSYAKTNFSWIANLIKFDNKLSIHVLAYLSADDLDGTGDHENFFNRDEKQIDVLIDDEIKNCTKAGLRMREVSEHDFWPAALDSHITILFSKLTEQGLQFYTDGTLDDIEHKDNDMVTYHKTVKAEYG